MCTGAVEISSAELSHTGRYSCTARNAAGSTHRHVQLTVQGKNTTTAPFKYFVHFHLIFLKGQNNNFPILLASVLCCRVCRLPYTLCCLLSVFSPLLPSELPVIESHPSALDVILNNPITLPCRATGSPRPTISWQKEGINIPATGSEVRLGL